MGIYRVVSVYTGSCSLLGAGGPAASPSPSQPGWAGVEESIQEIRYAPALLAPLRRENKQVLGGGSYAEPREQLRT